MNDFDLALLLGIIAAFGYLLLHLPCPETRGHHFGPVSDLCLNDGCNAEAGTWQYCKGKR